MATVKDRVVALCKSHGITVRQLEEETKIGNVVSRWDKYNPRMPKLAAVAAYFNVPIESLLYDDVPEQKEIPAAGVPGTGIPLPVCLPLLPLLPEHSQYCSEDRGPGPGGGRAE